MGFLYLHIKTDRKTVQRERVMFEKPWGFSVNFEVLLKWKGYVEGKHVL